MHTRQGTFNLIIALLLLLGSLTAASLEQVNTTSSQSLSNKTYVSPIFSGTATGSLGSLTLSSPTISNPTFSGTAAGTLTSLTLVAPDLGTPNSGTLTNATGLPVATGISGLGANVAAWLANPTSANFAAAVTGETGTGAPVFGTSPTITTGTLESPTLSGTPVFPDNVFTVGGSSDPSKKVAFEVDGLTASTTRTVTIPDRNLTLGNNLETVQAATSGTSRDFTGIPAGARKVHVYLSSVSTTGTSVMCLRIGAGSVDTTGYDMALLESTTSGNTTYAGTSAILLNGASIAAAGYHAQVTFSLVDPSLNVWVYSGSVVKTASITTTGYFMGNKTLSGALDRIRLTTVGGSDTFDAGQINVSYEF